MDQIHRGKINLKNTRQNEQNHSKEKHLIVASTTENWFGH